MIGIRVLKALSILLLLIPLIHTACQRSDGRQKIEQEAMELDRALNRAIVEGSLTVMDRILADTHMGTTPAGHPSTKAEEMAAFAAGETRIEALSVHDARVQRHGSTAWVTARASLRGQTRGREMNGLYRYGRLYAGTQGDLKLVASHWTPIRVAPAVMEAAAVEEGEIITVRPGDTAKTRQGHQQFVGISEATAGAGGLSMNLVVIPPGGQAEPHRHRGYETAIYVLQGRAETCYGEGLHKSVINEAGDFVYIPPDVPHQPRNLSDTEPVLAIVARNDPNEQESVVPYEPRPAD